MSNMKGFTGKSVSGENARCLNSPAMPQKEKPSEPPRRIRKMVWIHPDGVVAHDTQVSSGAIPYIPEPSDEDIRIALQGALLEVFKMTMIDDMLEGNTLKLMVDTLKRHLTGESEG